MSFISNIISLIKSAKIKLFTIGPVQMYESTLKIRSTQLPYFRTTDFSNTIISQEIITGKEGDNILNIYVKSLPVSSYTVELYTKNNIFVWRQNFSMK